MPIVSQATIDFVHSIAAEAERIDTPCGEGTMAWRCWGGGPPLVLLHGATARGCTGSAISGRWRGNSRSLRRTCPVSAFGDPPEPWSAGGLAAIVVAGLDIVLRRIDPPAQEKLHLAGFSFGGVIGGSVAAQLGRRLRRFTVVGSNGLGLERSPTPLRRVPDGADEEEEFATHRYNLNQLMIHDPDRIDELALYLQKTNHARAVCAVGRFSRSGALIEALPQIAARLDGIWGERDATAYPHVEERARLLRNIQPEARFTVVPGAGHWVQFEAAEQFNPILAEYAAG